MILNQLELIPYVVSREQTLTLQDRMWSTLHHY